MSEKEQLERVLSTALPFAKKMLSEDGEFYPFGAALRSDGSIVDIGAQQEGDDHPPSAALLRTLEEGLREMALRGEIDGSAVVCNVSVKCPGNTVKSDAVQISLEHKNGYSVEIFVPYEVLPGQVTYGKMFAQPGNHRIFE
jgi:hypothetical protein